MVATNSTATRSTLELMLDKLQQPEEPPADVPPALPARPVSRARLPRARKPLQLDFQRRGCGENGASLGFEIKRATEDLESFDRGDVAESDRFQKRKESSENPKEIKEKGICKIQKCYRGHQVRCHYKELRRGIIALQSFIRGENSRRGYGYNMSRSLGAVILIQKETRKYFERRLLEEHRSTSELAQLQSGIGRSLDRRHSSGVIHEPKSDQTEIPCGVLVDLQRLVLRSEARVRQKNEENLALKRRLEEMQKKWQQKEERLKYLEKEWQDQLTHIQECLAAVRNSDNQNHDTITITAGTPNGRVVGIHINPVYQQADQQESVNGDDSNLSEVGHEPACLRLRPREELRRLKLRFKAWKKEYKNKLRDTESTLKKLGNASAAGKAQKNWWGRSSH